MITRESECLLQSYNKDGYYGQVFTILELVAKTIFEGQNDKFYIKKYVVFIRGKSVIIEITLEGLPKINIAIKDKESLINAIIREMNK